MPTQLTNRFAEALQVANELHAPEPDPEADPAEDDENDEPPHASHLLQVAGMVLEAGGDEDQAIAALFHDAIEAAKDDEEAKSRESRIRDAFGDRPADIVLACTDVSRNGASEKSWKEQKERYIHHLWTEAEQAAVRVAAADKLATARRILRDYRAHGEAAWARYDGGRSGTLWYYRALVGAFRYRDVDGHVDELDALVNALEAETT